MNLRKLIKTIEIEQAFEQKTKSLEEDLRQHEAVSVGLARKKGNKKVYTPFSDRLKKGFTASIHLLAMHIHYNINEKVVVARCEETGDKKIARCHPSDKFDVKRGVIVATARVAREIVRQARLDAIRTGRRAKVIGRELEGMLRSIDNEGVTFSFRKSKQK